MKKPTKRGTNKAKTGLRDLPAKNAKKVKGGLTFTYGTVATKWINPTQTDNAKQTTD